MRKLLIANRGEIARRVLRSARARGYEVAVVTTKEDRDAPVRKEADAALEVPSFLDARAIVSAARSWGADLLHPGYGFLSENAAFADRVEKAGMVFVGPRAETMRLLGNKESAKTLAEANGVRNLASLGSGELQGASPKELEELLRKRGLEPPYLVKAAGGGGGRGMRIVPKLSDLRGALERASEEAASGFSDPTVFVERFLPRPRHVEIQVFGDGAGGGVFLGERECSMQRRYQKVIEEAPSPVVGRDLRREMGAAALALVRATAYRGAGTVEFLLDEEGRFYFLEVNTRLQVEHPVTEAVYGVDLVDAQLELAEGTWPGSLPAPDGGAELQASGWAIEARVLAEDPRSGFLPTPGLLTRYREPSGPGLRIDSGVVEGSRIHAGFDSLIAKVIAWGATRGEAVERLAGGLSEMIVHGPKTNLSFLQSVLRHPDFRTGRLSTDWIASQGEALLRSLLPAGIERRLSTPGFRERLSFVLRGDGMTPEGPLAGRFLEQGNDYARVGSDLEERPVAMRYDAGSGELVLRGVGERELRSVATALDETEMALTVLGETLRLGDPRARAHRHTASGPEDREIRAPMAGKVLEIKVSEGDLVEEGELVAVVESMKMQLEVNAPAGGRIERLLVSPGDVLDGPDVIAVVGS